MGFSVKLAPGVRVRASSRGVRTSLGPRAARLHVGGGRTGFSTGAGPVSYYTSAGGSRAGGTTRSGTGTAAANRQLAAASRAADKQAQALALNDALRSILNVHQATFPPARRPVAPPPPPIDRSVIRAKHVSAAKAATSVFQWAARKAALAEAERRAQVDAGAVTAYYATERAGWQSTLDKRWAALKTNAVDTVLVALADAFEDNEAAAAAVGVEGPEVTLVVVVPPVSAIPERRPTTTAAGNLSLKKLTKTETADMYKTLVCGHVLVTVKEAFAVAPGLTSARIVAVRGTPPDAYGEIKPEVVLAARFERARLIPIQWNKASAPQVVNEASSELILVQKGATRQVMPIDLAKEPELAGMLDTIEFEDLL